MDRMILQIPVSRSLKLSAEAVARDYGFSSLQETIRVILKKLANRELTVSIREDAPIQLSKRAEKRYAKMVANIKKGKNVTKTKNIEELFQLLRS